MSGPVGQAPAARLLGDVLRAPLRSATWRDLAFVLLELPLSVLGFVLIVAALPVGAALAVTPLGLWVISFVLAGARRLGQLHLRLIAWVYREPVPPATFTAEPGLLGWRRSMLTDSGGWRATGYLVVKLLVAVLSCGTALLFWVYGLLFVAYPVLRFFNAPVSQGADGTRRHGYSFAGIAFDTWPTALLVSIAGIVVLLAAPYAVRRAVALDRLLALGWLGAASEERLQDLQRKRGQVIEDSAATLRRIERDLHDGMQAHLVALAMQLAMVREAFADGSDSNSAEARRLLAVAQSRAKAAIADLREIVRGFHPPVLDAGLEPALHTLAAGCGVPVDLRVTLGGRASAAIESIAYFCTAELLTNVTRHSGAQHARVDVQDDDGWLRITVTDDGVGGAEPTVGSGLAGLAGRVRAVDGRVTIDSPVGGPTVATVELPGRV